MDFVLFIFILFYPVAAFLAGIVASEDGEGHVMARSIFWIFYAIADFVDDIKSRSK